MATILAVILGMGSTTVWAEDLAKLLEWSFYPNEIITYSPNNPPLITIADGGLHLTTIDQTYDATTTGKGYGFKKGTFTNTVWDSVQQWLTVAAPITLPNGSVPKSAAAWTDMTGNVLLLHFDDPPATVVTTASYTDASAMPKSASCIDIKGAGELYCPWWVPNVLIGGALRFDGQDDELLVSANPVPAGTAALTLEAWVNPSLLPTAAGVGIISQGYTNTLANYELGIQLVNGTATAALGLANHAAITGGSLPLNQWSHLAGSYDGSKMLLYVNGVQVASKDAPGPVVVTAQEVAIGTAWLNSTKGSGKASNKGQFAGTLDEVAIYTRALSASEIQDHYSRQKPIVLPDGQQFAPTVGIFESQIFSVGGPVSWDSLSWKPAIPYGIQLPNAAGAESGYSLGNNADMAGNVLLLHLNESIGAKNFADTSSNVAVSGTCGGAVGGQPTTCPMAGQRGRFDKATSFNGQSDAVVVPLAQSPTKALTVEAWIYLTDRLADSNVGAGIVSKGPQTDTNNEPDFELRLSAVTTFSGPGFAKTANNPVFSLAGHTYTDPMPYPYYVNQPKNYVYGSNLPLHTWHHVVGTYDGTAMKMYLNGVLVDDHVVSGGEVVSTNNPVVIGRRSSTLSWVANYCPATQGGKCYRNSFFPGKIDEVAIYNRALTPAEVGAHFMRGAAQPKFQIRFCKDSQCQDMKSFVGSDLTTDSYFTASAIPSAEPSTIQKIDLTKLGLSKSNYFQYRVLMESRLTTVFPSVESVTVDPPHYPINNPVAIVETQKTFAKMISFDATVAAEKGSEIWYQLSPDGKNWYFCSGSTWMNSASVPIETSDPTQLTSTKAQLQSCFADATLDAPGGSGQIWFKAFFHSPTGTESLSLNNVKIGYALEPSKIVTPPPSPTQLLTLNVAEGSELKFNLKKPDPSKTFTFMCAQGCPQGLSVDNATGTVVWSPNYTQGGTYDVQFKIEGETGATTQPLQIAVKEATAVPKIENPGDKSVVAGEALAFVVSASDPDGGVPNYVIASPLQDGMALDASTGAFTWKTKDGQAGTHMVLFRAVDNQDPKIYGERAVSITVNKSLSSTIAEATTPEEPIAPTVDGTEATTAPDTEIPDSTEGAAASPGTVAGCALIR